MGRSEERPVFCPAGGIVVWRRRLRARWYSSSDHWAAMSLSPDDLAAIRNLKLRRDSGSG